MFGLFKKKKTHQVPNPRYDRTQQVAKVIDKHGNTYIACNAYYPSPNGYFHGFYWQCERTLTFTEYGTNNRITIEGDYTLIELNLGATNSK